MTSKLNGKLSGLLALAQNREPTENFKGIYDFKKSFSADYHEFIGEYLLLFRHNSSLPFAVMPIYNKPPQGAETVAAMS